MVINMKEKKIDTTPKFPMMKIIIPIIIIGLIIGIILLINQKQNASSLLVSITGEELLQKLENKETFFFVRTQDGCPHCEEFKPILNRVLKDYNITAYELKYETLEKEDQSIQNKVKELFGSPGTPTTIFITNGEETTTLNRLSGSRSYTETVKALKDREFIK